MGGKRLYLWAFILTCGALTYYQIRECKRLPWPPRYIYAGLTFGLLDLFSLASEELAGVTAIGIVIATFIKRGWSADCNFGGPVATAQLTSANNGMSGDIFATSQPPSYAAFQQPAGNSPNVAPAQAPGTTLV